MKFNPMASRLSVLLMAGGLLQACAAAPTSPNPASSPTKDPTQAAAISTPASSSTQTPTLADSMEPEPAVPVSPTPQPAIRPETAGSLTEQKGIGYGSGYPRGSYGLYLSPDASRLAVLTMAGIAILSPESLAVERFIPAPSFSTVAGESAYGKISRDGTIAVTLSGPYGGSVNVWSMDDGTLRGEYSLFDGSEDDRFGRPMLMDISPDNSLLALSDSEGYLRILRLSDGEILRTIWEYAAYAQRVFHLEFDRKGGTLYFLFIDPALGMQSHGIGTASWTETSYSFIKLEDIPSGYAVFSPTISETGFPFGYFISGDQVGVFDYSTFGIRYKFDLKEASSAFAVSGNGRWLAAAGRDTDRLDVWEAEKTKAPAWSVTGAHGYTVWGTAISPDGDLLYSIGQDGWLRKWRKGSDAVVAEAGGFYPHFDQIVYAPDGGRLFAAAHSGSIFEFNSEDGALQRELINPVTAKEFRKYARSSPFSRVCAMDASADGALLAQICSNWFEAPRLWNLADGTQKPVLDAGMAVLRGTALARQMALSGDGRRLAVIYYSALPDHSVRIYDTANRALVGKIPAGEFVDAIALSPDGALLAVSESRQPLRVFDTRTGTRVAEIRTAADDDSTADRLIFTRDGLRLAVMAWDRLRMLDTDSWDILAEALLPADLDAYWTAWGMTPDGSLLAAGDEYGGLMLWDGAGSELSERVVPPDPSQVSDLAFSPDGLHLALLGADGRIRIFGTRTNASQ